MHMMINKSMNHFEQHLEYDQNDEQNEPNKSGNQQENDDNHNHHDISSFAFISKSFSISF